MTQDATNSEKTTIDTSAGAVMTRLGPAAWLAIAWAVLPFIAFFLVIRYRASVADALDQQEIAVGLAIYIAVFAITAGFGIVPTVVQALIGGYAFGLTTGSPAAIAGFTLASMIGFGISKLVAKDKVEQEIGRHVKAKAVRDALVGRSTLKQLGMVMLIRVPPNSPFAVTNLVLTSVKIPLWVYTLGTAVGMAPRTMLVVWLGAGMSEMDDAKQPLWMKIGGFVLMFAVLGVLGHLGNKAIEKVTKGEGSNAEGEGS